MNFPFKVPPLKHQLEEFEFSKNLPARALFWEMGTGKSKVIIDTMAHLHAIDKIDVVIIIAKKGEYQNWAVTQIPEHMPVNTPYDCCVYRSALKESEKQAIRDLVKPSEKLRIICINIETMGFDKKTKKFASDGGRVAAGMCKSSKKGVLLVVDESTCVKSYKSVRPKGVQKIAQVAKYRRILSGTPVPRSPLDLWGQALILGDGLLGCKTFTEYKSEYAIQEKKVFGTKSFVAITGYRDMDKLHRVVGSFGSVKERADCVDLPPKIYKKMIVPLTDRQQELYNEMRDLAMAELGDGEIIEAVNVLGVISRLDQIACGQLKRQDGSFEILESDRPDVLMEAVTNSSNKGIIWCNYKGLLGYLYEKMAQELGRESVGRYYGGVSDEERARTLWEFQNGSKLTWIVANQQSMGYAHTLTRGTENYYYSNGYNLEHRLQSEDRTMRIGQGESVLYGDFYSPGTVNEKILDNLRGKRDLATQVLGTRPRDWI